jgi:hypothetical protein
MSYKNKYGLLYNHTKKYEFLILNAKYILKISQLP